MKKNPRQIGSDAYFQGNGLEDNPFKTGGKKYFEWAKGWKSAFCQKPTISVETEWWKPIKQVLVRDVEP